MEHTTKIREKLITLRNDRNLSQQEFADMLGVSRSTVARWESGVTSPSSVQIENICKIFNININELYSIAPKDTIESKKKTVNKKFLISILILGFIFLLTLAGLIITIIFTIKDISYDTSTTLWIILIPANTPMLVLSVFLVILMVVLIVLIVYIFRRNKKE